MELNIMLFFQRIQTPLLDTLANLLSAFGEESLMIITLVLIYWAIDKRKGFAICMSLLTALAFMQTLKAIIRRPRPFQAYPDLIKGERISTATGYSFPSGHSTGATSLFSSVFSQFSNLLIKIFCTVLIIGVPISRLYLGVHWPLDVIAGTIIGVGTTIFLEPLFLKLYDDKKTLRKYGTVVGIVLSVIALTFAIPLQMRAIDEVAFSDFMKSIALFGAALFGASVEITTSDFVPAKSIKKKALSVVIGIAIILIIQASGSIVPESIYYIWAFVRYTLIGLSTTLLIPRLLIKLDIMKERSYYTDMFRDVI